MASSHKRARHHKQTIATNSEQARATFIQVLTQICDEASQPHPWIGKPDVLGEVIIRLVAVYMGAQIDVDDNRRQ